MNFIKLPTLILSLIYLITLNSCSSTKAPSSMGNMIARMEVKEPIEGVCDNNNVIAILPIPGNGQLKAKAPKTNGELTKELNSKVSFLTNNANYNDKGMVNLIINCKGELVRCQIDNKTKDPELDSQIVAVFAEMKTWTAGSVNSKPVDTSVLYSFKITDGIFTVN